MAKQIKKKEEEVVTPLDDIEIKVDEIEVKEEPEEEITIDTDNIEQKKPEKLVTIRVKEYTRVFIGEWYTFEPKKVYRVGEHVKQKLLAVDLLMPV